MGIQDHRSRYACNIYNAPVLTNELAIVYVPPQQTYTTTARSATIQFAASIITEQLPIVNTATFTDSFGTTLQRQAVAFIPKAWVYLPVMWR